MKLGINWIWLDKTITSGLSYVIGIKLCSEIISIMVDSDILYLSGDYHLHDPEQFI